MVTVSLLVIVLTISSISYRRSAKRSEIIAVAQQIAMDIRLMESFAANGQTYNNVKGSNIWGIHVDKNDIDSYLLFNTNYSDHSFYEHSGIYFKDYKKVKFSSGLTIDEIGYEDSTGNRIPVSRLTIRFIPPDPTIYITADEDQYEFHQAAYIRLKDSFNNSYKDVYINRFGLVDVVR